MKKSFLIVALGALAATSCLDVQHVYDNSTQELMCIRAYSNVATKAPVVDGVFPTSRTIQLATYYNVADAEAAVGGTSQNYFPFTEFTYKSEVSSWAAHRYWPFSGTLSMIAYSTADGTNTLTPTSTTWTDASNYAKGVSLVLPDNSAKQVDVLFAGKDAATKTNNALVFKHALAWLEFRALCNVSDVITITGITLNGAAHGGTVTALRSIDDVSFTWSDLSDRKDVAVPTTATALTPTAWQTLGTGIMIPPQERMTAGGGQVSFTIHYTVKIGSNDPVAMQYTCPFETAAWEARTKYVYGINMTLDAITVTAVVTPWLDGPEVEIPIPPEEQGPEGTSGKSFSVGANKKVFIATSNLALNLVDNRFELQANAYDLVEVQNENVGENYLTRKELQSTHPEMAYATLFGWGASAPKGTRPTNTSTSYLDYVSGVPDAYGGTLPAEYDWGGHNVIYSYRKSYDDINYSYIEEVTPLGPVGTWRSMTLDEWDYLFNGRPDAAQKYASAQIDGVTSYGASTVHGYVLLPESWTLPAGCSFTPGTGSWTLNSYTTDQWAAMEAAGAAFLPAAGYRNNLATGSFGMYGCYWTATSPLYTAANFVMMSEAGVSMGPTAAIERGMGLSVRLVRAGSASSTAEEKQGTTGGLFRVGPGAGDLVLMSRANLMYWNSGNKLAIQEFAYSYVEDNWGVNTNYAGAISATLFGWGASEDVRLPARSTSSAMNMGGGGDFGCGVMDGDLGPEYDWGRANTIYSATGTQLGDPGAWRCLSNVEWTYLFQGRTDAANKYGTTKINVNSGYAVTGLVVLPDNWRQPDGVSFTPGMGAWTQNVYSLDDWTKMEAEGAIFLPAAGYRNSTMAGKVCEGGHYWSTTGFSSELMPGLRIPSYAYYVSFDEEGNLNPANGVVRNLGLSVRLVRDSAQ